MNKRPDRLVDSKSPESNGSKEPLNSQPDAAGTHIDLPLSHDSALRSAVDVALAVYDDPELPRKARARRIIAKVLTMSFTAPGAAAAIAGELKAHADIARGLILNDTDAAIEALLRDALRVGQRALELARPVPKPAPPATYDIAIQQCQHQTVGAGYQPAEAELCAMEMVRTKSRFISCTPYAVVLEDEAGQRREVSRQQLRNNGAPKDEPFHSNYLAQFKPLASEHKSEEEKDNA